jgi:hypothetical protein
MGKRMEKPGLLFLCTVLLLVVQCGTTTVTVNIDALSYIPEDDRSTTYGENPVIPPYGPAVTVKTSVYSVPISGELETVTEVDEVQVALDFLVENQTGTADARLEIFMAGEDEDPFGTDALIETDIVLAPDSSYTVELRAVGDERIIELFSGNEVSFGAEIFFDASGNDDLLGAFTMTKFDIIISGQGHLGSD